MTTRYLHSGIGLMFLLFMLLMSAGDPVAANEEPGVQITIPSIQVEAPIVPVYIREFPNGEVTWDVSDLRMSVGHFEGMPFVGQGGNAVLGGHSERARGEADIFYNLHQVSVGDEIIVTANGEEYHYEVQRVFSVDPQDLSVLYPTHSERLTLITCDLASFQEESGSYGRRVVVVADRVL